MKVNSVIISSQHVVFVVCMIMPITWRYTDIYGVIICYITDHLDPTNYLLNFGIVALHELRPKVIIRFTLKNIRNNLRQSWTQLLQGETLEDLFEWSIQCCGDAQIRCVVKWYCSMNINGRFFIIEG